MDKCQTKGEASVKTLDDVKEDMTVLYKELRDGKIDMKLAAELANVTGKFLKAVQLEFAMKVFLERGMPQLKRLQKPFSPE